MTREGQTTQLRRAVTTGSLRHGERPTQRKPYRQDRNFFPTMKLLQR